jgi:hypothetical protein
MFKPIIKDPVASVLQLGGSRGRSLAAGRAPPSQCIRSKDAAGESGAEPGPSHDLEKSAVGCGEFFAHAPCVRCAAGPKKCRRARDRCFSSSMRAPRNICTFGRNLIEFRM